MLLALTVWVDGPVLHAAGSKIMHLCKAGIEPTPFLDVYRNVSYLSDAVTMLSMYGEEDKEFVGVERRHYRR